MVVLKEDTKEKGRREKARKRKDEKRPIARANQYQTPRGVYKEKKKISRLQMPFFRNVLF